MTSTEKKTPAPFAFRAAKEEPKLSNEVRNVTVPHDKHAESGPQPTSSSVKERTRGGWIPSGKGEERRETHKTRGTPRGRERRRQLLDTARRLFTQHGYFAVTIEDIVGEAEVARGSFYTYFESKMDIFRVITREVGDRIEQALEETEHHAAADAVDRLKQTNSRFIEVYRQNADYLTIFDQAASSDEEVRKMRLDARRRHIDRVVHQIESWQRKGLVNQDIDSETTGAALVTMTANFCMWWFSGEADYDDIVAHETVNNIWVKSLGIRREPNVESGAGFANSELLSESIEKAPDPLV